MRFLYAYRYKNKKEIPIYRDGPFWAVWGYHFFTTIGNMLWDISHFFLRETCEHNTLISSTKDGVIRCADCKLKLSGLQPKRK